MPGVWGCSDHRVAGPLVLLAHSGLLRGWLGARVLERRRDRRPFKGTFLCLRKKKKSKNETRSSETHKSVASSPGPVWVWGGKAPGIAL